MSSINCEDEDGEEVCRCTSCGTENLIDYEVCPHCADIRELLEGYGNGFGGYEEYGYALEERYGLSDEQVQMLAAAHDKMTDEEIECWINLHS